jgi:hypothetical protein
VGCAKSPTSPEAAATTSNLSISPPDNQTSVNTSGAVSLTFSKKLDKVVVENNFHLISAMALIDSLCPVSKTFHHGTMMSAMNDTSMMNHLDKYHSIHGLFTWNSDSLVCTFQPDSMLTRNMQYMVHLRREMVDMMNQRMGNMGMMGQQGTSGGSDMMFHFTTTP